MGSGPTDVEDRVVVLQHVELRAQWLTVGGDSDAVCVAIQRAGDWFDGGLEHAVGGSGARDCRGGDSGVCAAATRPPRGRTG
jgi:hypothetical protein